MGTSPVPSLNTSAGYQTDTTDPTRPQHPSRACLHGIRRGGLAVTPHTFRGRRSTSKKAGGFPVHQMVAPPIHRWSRLSGTPTTIRSRCSGSRFQGTGYPLAKCHTSGGHKQKTFKHIIMPTVHRITLGILSVDLRVLFSQSLPFRD